MYAVISRDQIQLPPGSVLRMPGTWDDYCALRDSRGDGSIPRIKFRDGEIVLMSPLLRHGREAHLLASVVGILLDSRDRNNGLHPNHHGLSRGLAFQEQWLADLRIAGHNLRSASQQPLFP